jgi:hypothetical protein
MLLAGLGLAGGWYLGTVAGPSRGPEPGSAQFGGPRPIGVERWQPPPPFKDRLQKRLAHQPQSPQPKRNPFVFEAAPSRPAPSERAGMDSVVEPNEPVAEIPTGPVFSLSGIAADEQDGTTIFTAIVTDGSQLHLLKVGDTLPGGLTVSRVTESTVTLTDEAGGEQTLRLR